MNFPKYCWLGADATLDKAGARLDSRMDTVRLGVFFPHEIVAAFYNFRSGDLFYSMLTGTPAVPQLCPYFPMKHFSFSSKAGKILYFVWSPPWHLYIFFLANLLAFYLTYLLAFYLTYLLAFYLAFYLAYLLAYLLAFYLANLLAFYLAHLLAFYLTYLLAFTFHLAYLLAFYLAVEVRQCPLGSGARGGGPAVPTGIWTARRRRRVRRRRRRRRALLKSSNPQLAGGEKHSRIASIYFPETCQGLGRLLGSQLGPSTGATNILGWFWPFIHG